ncbi:MAG: hypothetical protein M1441_02020 [Candidatus Parvarchaeota archaeon]|nr:hypothetical protein [Candidatus Parvarchaeota archaeon]
MERDVRKNLLPFYDPNEISSRHDDFALKYKEMASGFKTDFNPAYIKRSADFMLNYPMIELDDILKGRIKMTKPEKQAKISHLESILDIIGKHTYYEKEERPDYFANGENTEQTIGLLMAKTDRYRMEIYRQGEDYLKIKEWAQGVNICWDAQNAFGYSKNYARDINEYGGSIIFTVKREEEHLLFGRDFIGVDRSGKVYLFMDNLEGLNYKHYISDWIDRDTGAFKLAVTASFFFAERMGCQYIVAGDPGTEELFSALGTSKKRTAVQKANRKIGYQASIDPPADGEFLRSLSFSQQKYYYMRLV